MQSKYWEACSAAALSPKGAVVETYWVVYLVQHWEDLLLNKLTEVEDWVICSEAYWVEAVANKVLAAGWVTCSAASWEAEVVVRLLAVVSAICSGVFSVEVLEPARTVQVVLGIFFREGLAACLAVL